MVEGGFLTLEVLAFQIGLTGFVLCGLCGGFWFFDEFFDWVERLFVERKARRLYGA